MSMNQIQGLVPGCPAPAKTAKSVFHFVYDHHLDRHAFMARYDPNDTKQALCAGFGAMNGGWRFHINQLGQANLRKAYFTGNVDSMAKCLIPAPFTEIPDYDSKLKLGVYGFVWKVTPEVDQAITKSYGGTRIRQSATVQVPRSSALGGLTMRDVKCVFFVDLRNTVDNTTNLSKYNRPEFGKWMAGMKENMKSVIPKWYLQDLNKMLYGNLVNPEPIYVTSQAPKFNGTMAELEIELQSIKDARAEYARSTKAQESCIRQEVNREQELRHEKGKGKNTAVVQPLHTSLPRSEAYADRLEADNQRQRQKPQKEAARAEKEKAQNERGKKRRVEPETAGPPGKRLKVAGPPVKKGSQKPAMRMNAVVASAAGPKVGQFNTHSQSQTSGSQGLEVDQSHGRPRSILKNTHRQQPAPIRQPGVIPISTNPQPRTNNVQRPAVQSQLASQYSSAHQANRDQGRDKQAQRSQFEQSSAHSEPQAGSSQLGQSITHPRGQAEANNGQRVGRISSKGYIIVPEGITSINELTQDEREELAKQLREQAQDVFALWQRQKDAVPERTYPAGFVPKKCSIPWCIEIHVTGTSENHIFKHPKEPQWMEELARFNMSNNSKKRKNGDPSARPPKRPRIEQTKVQDVEMDASLIFSSPVGFGNDSVQESPAVQVPRPGFAKRPSFLEAPGLQAHLGLKTSGLKASSLKSPERPHRIPSPDNFGNFDSFAENGNKMMSKLNRTPPNPGHSRKKVQPTTQVSAASRQTPTSPLKTSSAPPKFEIDLTAAKALPTQPILPYQHHTNQTSHTSGPRKLSIDRTAAKSLQKLPMPPYEGTEIDTQQSTQEVRGKDYAVPMSNNVSTVPQDGHVELSLSPKGEAQVSRMTKEKPVSNTDQGGFGVMLLSSAHRLPSDIIGQQRRAEKYRAQETPANGSQNPEVEKATDGHSEGNHCVPDASELHRDGGQKEADVPPSVHGLPNPRFAKSLGELPDGSKDNHQSVDVSEEESTKQVELIPNPKKFAKSFGEVSDGLHDSQRAASALEGRSVVGFQMASNNTPDPQPPQSDKQNELSAGRARSTLKSTLKSTYREQPAPVRQSGITQVGGTYTPVPLAPPYQTQASGFAGERASSLYHSQWSQIEAQRQQIRAHTNGKATANFHITPNHILNGHYAAPTPSGPAPNYAAPTAASRRRGQDNLRRNETPSSHYPPTSRQSSGHNSGHMPSAPHQTHTSPHVNKEGSSLNLNLPAKPPTPIASAPWRSGHRNQPANYHPSAVSTSFGQNNSSSGYTGSPHMPNDPFTHQYAPNGPPPSSMPIDYSANNQPKNGSSSFRQAPSSFSGSPHSPYAVSQGYNVDGHGHPIPPPVFGPTQPTSTSANPNAIPSNSNARTPRLSMSTTPHLPPPNRETMSAYGDSMLGGRRPSATQQNAQQFLRGGKMGSGWGNNDKKSLSKMGDGRGQ